MVLAALTANKWFKIGSYSAAALIGVAVGLYASTIQTSALSTALATVSSNYGKAAVYNASLARNLETVKAQQEANATQYAAELESQREAALRAASKWLEIAVKAEELETELERLKGESDELKAWSDTVLPGYIADWMRSGSYQDGLR